MDENRVQHKQPVIQGVERVIWGNPCRDFGPPGGGLFVYLPSDYSLVDNLMEKILKKEDKLKYKGGFFKNKKGGLVLTTTNLYFVTKKGDKVFDIPVVDIVSVNPQKGRGNGVEHLYVLYNANGSEKKVKIEHFSFMSSGMGLASRIAPLYFASWEQMINDVRFGKLS